MIYNNKLIIGLLLIISFTNLIANQLQPINVTNNNYHTNTISTISKSNSLLANLFVCTKRCQKQVCKLGQDNVTMVCEELIEDCDQRDTNQANN